MNMNDLVRIHPNDNVAVALRPLTAGETYSPDELALTLTDDIPMGHKAALRPIEKGEKVIKYGFPIGEAVCFIPRGAHVHTHNLRTLLSGEKEYVWEKQSVSLSPLPPASFSGFPRADGRAGIRNEIWILPTVGCVNDIASALEKSAAPLLKHAEAVHAFRHPWGCSQMGEDQENYRLLLARLAAHPNAGGVLLLGLGCENSGIGTILPLIPEESRTRVRTLICQDVEDEAEEGLRLILELDRAMAEDRRVPCPAEKLVIGLKCGGSDGLSGITANPVIGGVSDRLLARGGTAILTEVPEMFGAEQMLMNRCQTQEAFEKTVRLINSFKRYFESNGQTVYENPSPGNKAGGISTLEDKSLGCTQKSGSAPVSDVLSYAEQVRTPGLNLLCAPGNDLVAATALAASGAQLVLFSTGRGTPFGCPVPTVKISTNTPLAQKKHAWIDFNAGALLEGETLSALSDALFALTLEIASGRKTKSEQMGCRDLAFFKTGVTL